MLFFLLVFSVLVFIPQVLSSAIAGMYIYYITIMRVWSPNKMEIYTLGPLLFSGITMQGGCCQLVTLTASGPSRRTQKAALGKYHQNSSLSNNKFTAYLHQNRQYSIMYDVRHGWRVS